ncbi:hypothetical protein ENBRE01_0803 [Enteropsectra breve]|nr:hypothetical protein ENBRE01_0803 [Enteropsectra breve]
MHYSKTARSLVRVTFLLTQISLILAGISTFILLLIVYGRSQALVQINLLFIAPLLAASVLTVTNGILGIKAMSSIKTVIVSSFIASFLVAINLQLFIAAKGSILVENNTPWINRQWAGFSDIQKSFVENQLECCGLETITDRATPGCKHGLSCINKIKDAAFVLRSAVQRTIIGFFLIESVGACLLALMKINNRV